MLRAQRGLTLAEIVVALAIVAVLSAVLYPAIAGQWRQGQASALANQFTNVREAIGNYRTNVQRYPRTLAQLTTALAATATDACGSLVPAANRNLWRGPYLAQSVVDSLRVGDAVVLDTLIRNPATQVLGTVADLQLRAIGVEQSTALQVEQQFDAVSDLNAGTIRWAGGTLTFLIAIRNC